MWFLTVVYTIRHGHQRELLVVEGSCWVLKRVIGCLMELFVAEERFWLLKRVVECRRQLLVGEKSWLTVEESVVSC